MAFTRENLSIYTNNVKNGVVPATYSYYDEDGDTVTDAGFFDDIRLNVGDQIWVIAAAYTSQVLYNIASVSAGAATSQASSAPT